MAEKAREIIRQQWGNRHNPDSIIRDRAVSLIKTHIVMLRHWEDSEK